MARKPLPIDDKDIPPRPECSCGKPSTHEVRLSVRILQLDRTFWRAGYDTVATEVVTVVCSECLRRNISVTFAASATMEKCVDAKNGGIYG